VKATQVVKIIPALWILAAIQTPGRAQTWSVLYNFGTNASDPLWSREIGAIVEGRDGSLYSTSNQGGTQGRGTVYKIAPDGKLTVLYNFDTVHGAGPQSGLTLGSDGNFYGTTYGGGAKGGGTIFKVTPEGALTVLYSFQNGNDGSYPISPPVQGRDGNFYGVTTYANNQQYGAVYKVTPAGAFTLLYTFKYGDIANVGTFGSSLIAASDGNFYGTTFKGGTGYGTVFKITPNGSISALHKFDGAHGAQAYNLMQASDGNLYGTCYSGGSANFGLVYKLTLAGEFTVLHNFAGTDGASPAAGLVEGTDGNLYGATKYGGTGSRGVLYRIGKSGADFKVLYNRNINMTEGMYCVQTPVQHTNGKLYGCTYQGGSKGGGVFYSLDAGLKPSCVLTPTSGKVGASVGLIGQGLAGTTGVTFNGTAAKFTVVSDTYLTVTVPAGAMSGSIQVTTPKGTLNSVGAFQVLP